MSITSNYWLHTAGVDLGGGGGGGVVGVWANPQNKKIKTLQNYKKR